MAHLQHRAAPTGEQSISRNLDASMQLAIFTAAGICSTG